MAIEFKGLDEVMNAFDDVGDVSGVKVALGKACSLVERAAKEKAPKDTGELRRSISSRIEDTTGIVFTPLEYAPYIEFGTGLFAENGGRKDVPWNYQDDRGEWHSTSGMKPQPYLRPALNENRERIIEMIKEGIKND